MFKSPHPCGKIDEAHPGIVTSSEMSAVLQQTAKTRAEALDVNELMDCRICRAPVLNESYAI